MAWGRWLSIMMGVGGALAAAALLWYFQPAPRGNLDDTLVMFAAAGAAGLCLGLLHALVGTRYEIALRRLTSHVESLARGDQRPSLRPGMGLNELAAVVERCLAGQKQKLESILSHKRELEIQLRISDAERQHAQAILNSIVDAVLVTDSFNELALANEAAGRVLGFDLAQALRRPVDQIVSDPALVKLIKDTREGGDAALRRHIEHVRTRNGQQAIYDVTLACVTNAQQNPPEPTGVVTILRDITREKEIAEMKSDFVSSVSHELRTPLSSIKAYLEMLIDGEARDEHTRAEFYNIIQGETNRLSRLIDNILNISRIESGVVKVQREHINLPALIKDAIDVMLPQARAKNITLQEVPTPVYFQVVADKDMIYQATLNLISNAIKYTPNNGKVTVALTVNEHARLLNVAVTDTGVGVPPDALPHLFQKFYRVAEHKKMAKGTGLGLNLVKQIVEGVHAGKVSVVSQPGKGSTFTFSLPMAEN